MKPALIPSAWIDHSAFWLPWWTYLWTGLIIPIIPWASWGQGPCLIHVYSSFIMPNSSTESKFKVTIYWMKGYMDGGICLWWNDGVRVIDFIPWEAGSRSECTGCLWRVSLGSKPVEGRGRRQDWQRGSQAAMQVQQQQPLPTLHRTLQQRQNFRVVLMNRDGQTFIRTHPSVIGCGLPWKEAWSWARQLSVTEIIFEGTDL